MKKKNNDLTGQGIAHPENEQQFNFADVIPVISGVIGRQSTSVVNNSQSPAAERASFQQDISLKNAHGASGWKVGNIANFAGVNFYDSLLVAIGSCGDRVSTPKNLGATHSGKFFAQCQSAKYFAHSIKKGQHSALTLWVASMDHSSGVSAFRFLSRDWYDRFRGISSSLKCIGFLSRSVSVCSGGNNTSCSFAMHQSSVADLAAFRRLSSPRATLTIRWISSPAFVPISSTLVKASSDDSNKFSLFPSAWRRAISQRAAVTKNAAVDSWPHFTASISSKTSCGMRIDICLDLSLLVFDAIETSTNFLCDLVYTKINHNKHLKCDLAWYNLNHMLFYGESQQGNKNDEARQCWSTNRASNQSRNGD